MHKDDEVRLQHMLDAAREARSFVQGQSRKDLDLSRMLVLALVKDIEIVGEAATRIAEDVQRSHSDNSLARYHRHAAPADSRLL